jgi:hypothetical protein
MRRYASWMDFVAVEVREKNKGSFDFGLPRSITPTTATAALVGGPGGNCARVPPALRIVRRSNDDFEQWLRS